MSRQYSERKISSIDIVQKLDDEILNACDKIQQYKKQRRQKNGCLTPADIEDLKKLQALIEQKLAEKRNLGW